MMRYVIIIMLVFLIPSCYEEGAAYDLELSVDAELLPYVNSFEKEANLRGLQINWSQLNMTIDLVNIETDAVGRCLTYSDDSRKIELDKNYWDNQSDIDKEFVIFHELGHCVLDRGHLDSSDVGGRCVSIMHSSDNLCRNNYTLRTREAFLDELFL